MTDTLRMIFFYVIGAWACFAVYQDLKSPERRRRMLKTLYWHSALVAAFGAYVFSQL
ncbi:hypothetical protein H0A71_18965 [Alcaligenaceae bacterium]|nr:hypothetical protein [Alcaligenaceae bacterium]